ncbi:hypothetical protein ACJ72_07055 [Emergomyces africanus]|uniref:Uncharacterized protein n=1 Tax=Emergomyces africanus TaxID=1955775 RepID=A0A1B7NPN7_9EURO|nr:hypothetical protein ACJ72_07055 [Emergomyces africanus]
MGNGERATSDVIQDDSEGQSRCQNGKVEEESALESHAPNNEKLRGQAKGVEIEKVGERYRTSGLESLGPGEQVAGQQQAAASLLQLRVASVIGSVCLAAVTSLLCPLEYRVGSASSECGWLARRLDGRSKGEKCREGTEIGRIDAMRG